MPQFKARLLHFLVTDPGQVTSAFWILAFSSEQDAAYSLLSLVVKSKGYPSYHWLAMKTPPPHPLPSTFTFRDGGMQSHSAGLGGHDVWLGGISFAGAPHPHLSPESSGVSLGPLPLL